MFQSTTANRASANRGPKAPQNARRPQGRQNLPEVIRVPSGSLKLLENIQLDPVIQTALFKMGAKLSLEISSSSTVIMSVVSTKDNSVVGTIDDLQRMSGFRTFVNQQKKVSSAAETLEPTVERAVGGTIWYRAHGGNERFLPPRLTMEAVAKDRELGKLAAMIEANLAIVFDVLENDDLESKTTLQRWGGDSLHVLAEACLAALEGKPKEKGWLETALFAESVPLWAFRKLTGAKLPQYKQGTAASVVLFPDDPSKNISFTVKELREHAFRHAHAKIIAESHQIGSLVRDNRLLRILGGAPDTQAFDDPADGYVARVMKAKVVIPTPVNLLRRMFDAKAKGKFPNLLFRPDFSSPDKGIACLSNAILACSDFTPIGLADSISTFWKRILADDDLVASFKGATRAKNVFALITDDWDNQVGKLESFKKGSTKEMRSLYREQLIRMLGASDGGALKERIESILPVADQEEGKPKVYTIGDRYTYEPLPAPPANRLEWGSLKNDGRHLDLGSEVRFALKIEEFSKKSSRKEGRSQLRLVPLGSASKALLKEVKAERNLAFLHEDIENWLRGFSSLTSQKAAAQIVYAQLDDIISSGNHADEDVSDQDSDEESDEADD